MLFIRRAGVLTPAVLSDFFGGTKAPPYKLGGIASADLFISSGVAGERKQGGANNKKALRSRLFSCMRSYIFAELYHLCSVEVYAVGRLLLVQISVSVGLNKRFRYVDEG